MDSTVAGSTVAGSTVAGSTVRFQHSRVAESMPDSRHFTVADFIRPFANFTAAVFTTAIFVHSTMDDFITIASAVGLSWFPLSAAGGGVADGAGPIMAIHTGAITGTELMSGTGAPIRRATTLM